MIRAGRKLSFMTREPSILYKETPYRLRNDVKRFRWLANLCWSVLHKLNALEMYSEKVTTWAYTDADQKKLTDMVMTMRNELYRYFENPEEWVVVVGAFDFQEAMQSPMFMNHMTFEAGPIYSDNPYRRIMGFDVHVVPWLKGMAVLPRVVIETKKIKVS